MEDFIDVTLKTQYDIVTAVEHMKTIDQNAAWTSTPQIRKNNPLMYAFPSNINDLISVRLKARKSVAKNHVSA